MWNRCKLVRETLDLLKPSLILELQQTKMSSTSYIAVELVLDLRTLIKIMEVAHNNQEILIAPHIKAAEIPTRITTEDIRVYSQWGSSFSKLESTEDKEDGINSISFYKKTITKHRIIKNKLLQINSLKKLKKQLEERVTTLLKENVNKLKLEKKEHEKSLEEHQKRCKDLQWKHEAAVIQIRRKDEALEELRNRSSYFNHISYIKELQSENLAYEIEDRRKSQKIQQLVRLLRIQQVGGADRSFNLVQ